MWESPMGEVCAQGTVRCSHGSRKVTMLWTVSGTSEMTSGPRQPLWGYLEETQGVAWACLRRELGSGMGFLGAPVGQDHVCLMVCLDKAGCPPMWVIPSSS